MSSSLAQYSTQLDKLLPSRVRRLLLTLLAAFAPAIVAYAAISAHARVSDFMPAWNDEVSYWHQIVTFKEVGFEGGYYSYYERPPAADFTHFYTYGPWHPMFYGMFARLLGWNFLTPLLVNVLLLAGALVVFCYATRLDERQLLLLAFGMGSFWMVIFYLFTNMQEAFQQMFAVLIAAAFYWAMVRQEQSSVGLRAAGLVIIILAAITRLSWVILVLPFLVISGRKTWRRIGLSLVITMIVTVLVMLLSQYTGAPGNNSIFKVLSGFSGSLFGGLSGVWEYFHKNFITFVNFGKDGLDTLQTTQVLVFTTGFGIAFILLKRRKNRVGPTARSEAGFHFYNLFVIIIASCTLYLIGGGGDYRVIGSHLLVSLLLLIAYRRYKPAILLIVSNILFISMFLNSFQIEVINARYNPDHSLYESFKPIAEQYMPYQPDAPTPWCNTLLFPVDFYDARLLGVPPGIGLSFFINPYDPVMTFKSHYLLLREEDLKAISLRDDAPDLELLSSTASGNLYRNRKVDCTPTTTG